jgi:hypothetical protein
MERSIAFGDLVNGSKKDEREKEIYCLQDQRE